MIEKNITIMKYRLGNSYYFEVLDKYDEPDEAIRLDEMITKSFDLARQAHKEGIDYEQLWIKSTVIV